MEGKILQIINNRQRDILANTKLQNFQWLRMNQQQEVVKYQNAEIQFKEENRFYQHKQYQWVWYKNLNIPTFSYYVTQCSVGEQQLFQQQLDIKSLHLTMQLYAFKEPDLINHFSSDKPSFQMINLQGSTMVKIEEHTTQISGVKFMDTSFNEKLTEFNIFDPFLPDSFEKSYLKVNPKSQEALTIKEDIDGLLNYFTASSIRHKVDLLNQSLIQQLREFK